MRGELVDGVIEGLAFFPEIVPEVAVFFEADRKSVDVELGRIEAGFEFGGIEWS